MSRNAAMVACLPLLMMAGLQASAWTGTATSATPTAERLFPQVAPGMLLITAQCRSERGIWIGSGFLVGPRTLVTALHVLRPNGKATCTLQARQEGTRTMLRIDKYRGWPRQDIAVAHLSAPLGGYYFGITSRLPRATERVIGLGYSLANPLALNQGSVLAVGTYKGVPWIKMNLLGTHGSSG